MPVAPIVRLKSCRLTRWKLSKFAVWAEKQKARSASPGLFYWLSRSGLGRLVLLDESGDVTLRSGTDDFIHDLTILEEEDGGD